MNTTDIDLISNGSRVASFAFRNPTSQNVYVATEVLGLEPPDFTRNFYGKSIQSKKVKYFEMKPKNRTVVMKIELRPTFQGGEDYSALRDNLYRIISNTRLGDMSLEFRNAADVWGTISGYISKVETNLFDRKPSVVITIECDSGYIKGPSRVYVDTPAAIMSSGMYIDIPDGVSTAPHGFRMRIQTLNNWNAVTMRDTQILGQAAWEWSARYIGTSPGYITEISSEDNDKRLRYYYGLPILEDSLYYDCIGRIEQDKWPIIFPGNNRFWLQTQSNAGVAEGQSYVIELSYVRHFWGL